MRIIAKSNGQFLIQHTGRVYFAAKQILKYSDKIVRLFKLSDEQKVDLKRDLLISALVHDLGKANSEFIDFFNKKIEQQNVRHEHVSVYIINFLLKDWLEKHNVNPYLIMSVVLGHHLKSPIEDTENYPKIGNIRNDDRIPQIYLESVDVEKIIKLIAKEIKANSILQLQNCVFKKFNSSNLEEESNKLDKRYVFALKVLLIWSDTLGSAEFDVSIKNWVLDSLGVKNVKFNDFLSNIRDNKSVKKLNNIQLNCAKLSKKHNRLAVVANCGSGKTLAELYFAKEYLINRGYDRIVHITPTKSLVNEVYSKYFIYTDSANIFHSQRVYSLKSLNIDLEDRTDLKDILCNLSSVYNAMTPDQILSAMIYNRKGILLLMTLLNSVVVFDEIHAYDSNMLRFFKDFCKQFDVPIIVMSATTSNNLISILNDNNFKIIPNPDNTFAENFRKKRYNISFEEMNYSKMIEVLNRKFNIALIIVNTVNRCRGVADRLLNDGFNVICYHSRYRFKDRLDIAKKIEIGFDKPTVIVSTQVLEIGIDIDADLLISELAPMSSLIQRMGRVNRKQDTNKICDCLFYLPGNSNPYSDEDVLFSKEIIIKLTGLQSYYDLSSCLDGAPNKIVGDKSVCCFDINPLFTYGRDESFRESGVPSINCIVYEDKQDVKNKVSKKEYLDPYYVPVPIYDRKYNTQKFPPTFNQNFDKILSKLSVLKEDYYDNFGYNDHKDICLF
jgi:CRISPR-associated endonuclease/helicase Cas3